MAKLDLEIKKQNGKFLIKFNAERFEKLANVLGFYNPEFLRFLEKSVKNYKKGEIKPIENLFLKK